MARKSSCTSWRESSHSSGNCGCVKVAMSVVTIDSRGSEDTTR
jgi:hypothetical protein